MTVLTEVIHFSQMIGVTEWMSNESHVNLCQHGESLIKYILSSDDVLGSMKGQVDIRHYFHTLKDCNLIPNSKQ